MAPFKVVHADAGDGASAWASCARQLHPLPDGANLGFVYVTDLLADRLFFRINRQYIIHFRAIREMYAYSKSRVKLELMPSVNDDDIIVSTERSPHFKRWLVGHDRIS